MLNRIVLLSSLLVTSMTAHAGLIQYGDYKRDSASNIVTGGGLEWLKWDVTKGMSIDSALASYASQGWRLASNDEMASLFNLFQFGKTDWNAKEGSNQEKYLPWNSSDINSSHASFVRLFGGTEELRCNTWGCYDYEDPYIASYAYYGSDTNSNGVYNLASVRDDATYNGWYNVVQRTWHFAELSKDIYPHEYNMYNYYGVALVRNSVPDNTAVPTPGSIGLLALGLVALGYRRRNVLGH